MKSVNIANGRLETEERKLSNSLQVGHRHVPCPKPDISYILLIVLRLEDFHLFQGLYGDSFSRSLQENFESAVHRAPDK